MCPTSVPSAAIESPESRSAPSRTSTNGAWRAPIAVPRRCRARAGAGLRSGVSGSSADAGSGSTRSSAAATCWSSVTGSLSPSSSETQANGRTSRWAHCERSVVLPYPAGATTSTSGKAPAARSRLTSAVRETVPAGGTGTRIFESTTSNGSAGGAGRADEHGLCARLAQLGVARVGGSEHAAQLDHAGDGLLGLGNPLARVCAVRRDPAIRGSADYTVENTEQITTICTPVCTGLVLY